VYKKVKPVRLAIPGYYDLVARTPEDLFSNELQFNAGNYDIAQKWGRKIFRGFDVHDPYQIMAEHSDSPTLHLFNHQDLTDPVAIGSAYAQMGYAHPRYAAKAELFKESKPDRAAFIGSLGAYPVDRALLERGNSAAVTRFMQMSRHILEVLEEPLLLFPGGHLHPGKDVGPISNGCLVISRRAKKPIIIAALMGTRLALPRVAVVRRSVATLYFHEMFMPEEKPTLEAVQASMQQAYDVARDIHRSRET